MATTDFSIPATPESCILYPPPKGSPPTPRELKVIEEYKKRNKEQQAKYLRILQRILLGSFYQLRGSEDLTGQEVPKDLRLSKKLEKCLYRAAAVPGVYYNFNFVLPNESKLSEILSQPIESHKIVNHLYAKTCGRFDLELYKRV